MMNPNLHRIELIPRASLNDPKGNKVQNILKTLGASPVKIRSLDIYIIEIPSLHKSDVGRLCEEVFRDPILHEARVNQSFGDELEFDWYLEIGYKPGVTDNVGRSAQEAVSLFLGHKLSSEDHVYAKQGYFISGALDRDLCEKLAHEYLMNPLIEYVHLVHTSDWSSQRERLWQTSAVKLQEQIEVQTFRFQHPDELMTLSRERTLALSPEEAGIIVEYFQNPEVHQQRLRAGISESLTDVELEVLAQTWSEHCKHKIFNANIHYQDHEIGESLNIRSLYKTYVQASTAYIRKALGEDDWCVSVFSDNAGVIRFNEDYLLTMKVETHNSPSALDPYGGALTGIVGVNRDSFGTGLGAELIFNTNVFCFASPFYEGEIPPNLMHPKRIYEGVRLGVEHGGNKSGIPTVNGSLVFHERFLGKPLVFCGTGGLMPASIQDQPSHLKGVQPGDKIVMVGGRIGKDGIHGATFSSEALHEGSPATAVQIGAPIVQKRMFDFLVQARDRLLYRCITDNGAGGLSSSVGEMAEFSNGCHIELDKAPLKYQGLQPWEIFISEAQERMTLAVPPENVDAYLALSEAMGVESSVIGEFDDSGFLKASYQGKLVACLDMEFLHKGVPPMQLEAVWKAPSLQEPEFEVPEHLEQVLHSLLGRLNICSKESVVRQYDHEVQGGSVIKPMVGAHNDGPSDAAIVRPLLESMEGVAIGHGICPRYSDLDAYHMAACAIDEAVRNVVAVGAMPDTIAGLDNFCWCDPITSDSNPDGAYKMAQLVRANQALYHYTTEFGVPCISGKDSMKNDYRHHETKISIPPTLLFTTVAKVADVRRAVTMDVKQEGDLIYLLGKTHNELGGSEYYDYLGHLGKNVPKVDAASAKQRYHTLYQLIQKGWVQSCHDCSDGGFAVAAVESAFAGDLGMDIDIANLLVYSKLRADTLLFSESASRFLITVSPEHQNNIESAFASQACYLVGQVTSDHAFTIRNGQKVLIQNTIESFKSSWQSTLSTI